MRGSLLIITPRRLAPHHTDSLRVRRAWPLLFVLAGVSVLLVAGCGYREKICRDGEYPAFSLEFPESGRICVRQGEAPPAGYAKYPAGKVPYWLDEDYTPTVPAGTTR